MLKKSVFLLILLISLEGISEARLTPISLLLPTPDKVITVTDNKGQITRYSYDMADRLVRVDYDDGSYTSMTYDVVGRLTYVYDSERGQISYVYSGNGCVTGCGGAADRVIKEITPLGVISYAYDAVGLRTSMTVAGQEPVYYNYDGNGRLVSLGQGDKVWTLGYDAIGRRTSLTRPTGVTTAYTYDVASNLLNMEHLNPLNEILEKISYVYDVNSNRISMDRFSSFSGLTGESIVELPEPASNITYNQANRMLSFNEKHMTYDANGNMTSTTDSCGTTTHTWNVRNQLIAINGFNADCTPLTASFKYDALGRRIEKTVNGKTTQYLYDGLDIIQEIEGGMVTANYIRTLNIDEPLALINQEGIYYYLYDGLGSVIGLADHSGNEIVQYYYDPFGDTTSNNPSFKNPFQYTARENDNTGLYYYRARYYDAKLGRFISEDPIGLAGGDVNFYVRVGNNPVNFIDPLGLHTIGFNGTGLLVVDDDGNPVAYYPATSGNIGVIDPSIKNKGPIPPGNYILNPKEFTGGFLRGLGRYARFKDWGFWRVPLHPETGTNTFGRSGFFIHGGVRKGTGGCIQVDTPNEFRLHNLLKDHKGPIKVNVFYPGLFLIPINRIKKKRTWYFIKNGLLLGIILSINAQLLFTFTPRQRWADIEGFGWWYITFVTGSMKNWTYMKWLFAISFFLLLYILPLYFYKKYKSLITKREFVVFWETALIAVCFYSLISEVFFYGEFDLSAGFSGQDLFLRLLLFFLVLTVVLFRDILLFNLVGIVVWVTLHLTKKGSIGVKGEG